MVLIVTFLAINGLVIYGIGAAWSFMNTGADKTSMLHLELPMEDVYKPNVEWINLENPGRPMEEQALGEITNDYMNAWHVRNIAYKKNDRYGIEDFYTDSARVRLYDNIDLNKKNNHWYKRTTLNHNSSLDFYTADGTMVVFKDYNVEEYQEVYEGETLLSKEKDTTSYQVMMLLEDGFWRIRHLKEIPTPGDTTKRKQRKIRSKLKKVENIKGINYYPKDSPWNTFGKKFNDTIINQDFEIIKNMGLNTIRVFIQYDDFGKNRVDYKKLQLLKTLLDSAEENELDVLITLFDFYGDYDVSNWTLTHRQADKADFVSYHYYRDIEDFKSTYDTLNAKVPNKPKVLQEYGMSSYKGVWNLYRGAAEEGQKEYYKEMQQLLKDNNIPYMFWTLYDFKNVPSSVAGNLPWKTKKQHFFGCLDSLGNKKPAYFELINQ